MCLGIPKENIEVITHILVFIPKWYVGIDWDWNTSLQWIRIAIRTQLTNLVGRLNVFRVL